MKKMTSVFLALMGTVCFLQLSYAAEHGGKEHGGLERVEKKEHAGKGQAEKEHGGLERGEKEHAGKEHGGVSAVKPSAENIRQTMKDYVMEESKETETFDVYDPEIGKARKLSLLRVHERVGKTGDYYYSCADFVDVETGQMLDLDLDVEHKGGDLSVVDVRIHKLNGKERYTYDENDNRIPVAD